MSDEIENENPGGGEDRFQNFQKEMERKFGNTNDQISQLMQSQQQLIEALNTKQTQSQQKAPSNDDISDLIYTDPAKYAELIEERAAKKIEAKLSAQNQVEQQNQSKIQNVLSKLAQDYPELHQPGSELSQKAVEIYNNYSPEDQSNQAVAYRAAILEAVGELGVQKVSKRKSSSEDQDFGDFVISGQSNTNAPKGRKPKVDANTVAFAQMMGLDVTDKEVLKNLAKRSQRDYSKYGK